MKFILSPPPYNVRKQDKLWCGIGDDTIDVVMTSRYTFLMTKRLQISKGDFSRCPNGLLSAENCMQLLFSSGMVTGCITPERFVGLTSATPARLPGLWPQKGLLAPGSDGNIATIDPHQSQQIQHRHPHGNADYSPWEGFICQGAIVRALSCGETISCDGTFTGKVGRSRSLRCKPFVPPMP